ncbi:hypothetical protein MTBPR1_10581 [Candidatus Terasakiella magnetica]|uniref:Uncharacterized protein n=1 Tax=Candidatus Terasakiella magnetica TaxID=1867952 RepID=A0A1C3RDP5_9PROT|nr:GGDEF domain-containing phosphodiesterase [Candidatus Terasakiella magnetica]SCA55334.1 hypothetical protein MTBPR1_10581 [Candidatus Terasakiella magnetica]
MVNVDQKSAAHRISQLSFDAVITTDALGQIQDFNKAAETMFGYGKDEVIGRQVAMLFPDYDTSFKQFSKDKSFSSLVSRMDKERETFALNRSGDTFFVLLRTHAQTDVENEEILFIFKDLSHDKESDSERVKLLYFDSETGLPNRSFLHKRLNEMISSQTVHGYLAMVDVWGLKELIGTFSHRVIRSFVQGYGRRLIEKLPLGSSVYSTGPWQLSVHYQIPAHETVDIHQAAEDIFNCIRAPLPSPQGNIYSDGLVGISDLPASAKTSSEFIERADIALHLATGNPSDSFAVYDPALGERMRYRTDIGQRLHEAVDEMPFRMVVQPQFDMSTGQIIGAESLIRWPTKKGNYISPAEFIPIAEALGLIVDLTDWSLNQACRTLSYWKENGVEDVKLAVNISAALLTKDNFSGYLIGILRQYNVAANMLELEITETALMQNVDDAAKTLADLNEHGFTIAVDDFGTGHSSLSYLKLFKINKLKIDQSFVKNCLEDPTDLAIVETVIRLGHALNLRIIAEGIETSETADKIKELGCNIAQGYYYAKPFPVEQFLEYREKHIAAQ